MLYLHVSCCFTLPSCFLFDSYSASAHFQICLLRACMQSRTERMLDLMASYETGAWFVFELKNYQILCFKYKGQATMHALAQVCLCFSFDLKVTLIRSRTAFGLWTRRIMVPMLRLLTMYQVDRKTALLTLGSWSSFYMSLSKDGLYHLHFPYWRMMTQVKLYITVAS